MRSRWQWTHTYGMHLLVSSIAAVVLAGAGLITVVTLSDADPTDPPDPTEPPIAQPTGQPPTGQPTAQPPTELTTPTATLEVDCVMGIWQAVALEDIGFTGTWTLVAGGPTFEYREDRTGVIDYAGQGDGTTFEFHDDLLGGTSTSVPTGRREFEFLVDTQAGAIRHIYQDVLGGAQMHGIPYSPSEDVFTTTCTDETMTMTGNDGSVELQRLDP